MDLLQAQWLLKTFNPALVRINPRNSGGGGDSTHHWMGARLLGVKGDMAVVQPKGHKKTELVPLATIKTWKSAIHSHMGQDDRMPSFEPPPGWTDAPPVTTSIKEAFERAKEENEPKEKKKMGSKWLTKDDIAEVFRLKAKGLGGVEIASAVGTTSTTVYKILAGNHRLSELAKAESKLEADKREAERNAARIKELENKLAAQAATPPPPAPAAVEAPVIPAQAAPAPTQGLGIKFGDSGVDGKLLNAIKGILALPITETQKLFMIETLVG